MKRLKVNLKKTLFKHHMRLTYTPKSGTSICDMHCAIVDCLQRFPHDAQVVQNKSSVVINIIRDESPLNLLLEDLGYFDTWSE